MITGGGAEGAGPRAVALHEGLVDAALPHLSPARAHDVLVRALSVLHFTEVAGVAAVDVHVVSVPDALSHPRPAGAVRTRVPALLRPT